VFGAATALDPAANTVTVTTAGAEPRVLSYDFIVLASGARSPTDDVLWKNPGTYEEGAAKIRDINEKVGAAQSYVVGGAGMTGVETAAELAAEYKDKEVVLISADAEILGGDATAAAAESQITKLGVKVRKGVKVTGSASTPDASGKTEVSLSDGSKILTDLYIPTIGLVPNSEYIPAALLTERGYLAVDDEFRAKAHENIWGTGDLVSVPRASLVITDKQTAGVFQNVDAAIKGKPQVPVKGMPFDVMLVSTGRKSGAGRLGVVSLPSFVVWGMKSRNLIMNMIPGYASGSKW
jgi:apoptosis-inducing factor 2